MLNDDLWEILEYWSYWKVAPPSSVTRSLTLPPPDSELVLAIQGVRRCGKSTLLAQLMARWDIPRDRCLFVNFEDPRLSPHLGPELLSRTCELFESRRPDGPLWFFFDEVQNVPQWEKWRRQQLVRNKKYYPVDTGLRKAVVAGAAPDLGKALECAAFLALRKRFGRVFYWRQVREVNFVVVQEGRPLPIQVSWGSPQERHELALDEFYQAFPASHEGRFLSGHDLVENFAVGWSQT